MILGLLLTFYGVWGAIADYQMQIREHWDYRCTDVQLAKLIGACVGAFISLVSYFAFRRVTLWTHRLHGTPQV